MMNYIEVKIEENKIDDIDTNSFVSSIIEQQKDLGAKKRTSGFNKEELISLGFIENKTTGGFYMQKDFDFEELETLTRKVSSLENHILTHSFLIFKIHEDKLYIWDTSLIYEGVDSFEYCLEHHNTFKFAKVYIVTNSDNVNEELLEFSGFTKRFTQPNLTFITTGKFWDKKEGCKVLRHFIKDINEYIHLDIAKDY